MSYILDVVGFIPPNDEYREKRKLLEELDNADLDIPDELEKFFRFDPPNDAGIPVELEFTSGYDEVKNGRWLQIDITKIPAGVKTIRFSYER
jgi:hypothetical protein